MKAIAKRDMGYPEYPYTNWITGNRYAVREVGNITHIMDEGYVEFHFNGTKEDLSDSFYFVEE